MRSQNLHKETHAEFAISNEIQQAQARSVGKRPKQETEVGGLLRHGPILTRPHRYGLTYISGGANLQYICTNEYDGGAPVSDQTLPKVLKAHVSLTVSNLEASVDFYRKMLGIEPFKVKP